MPDSTLVAILLQAGVAGVFCILFLVGLVFPRSVVTDLREENRLLKQQLAEARETQAKGVDALATNNAILEAFREGQRQALAVADSRKKGGRNGGRRR